MSLRTVFSSRRDQMARRKRTALKFVPAIHGLEDRKLLSSTPPVAGGGSVSTLHDHAVSGSLYAYDMDGSQVTVNQVSGPSNGTLTLDGSGSFTYTPNQGYVGQDSFTFDASDQNGTSDPATETIDVTNQAPVAGDGSVSTLHDHAVSGSLYAYDMDGDTVTVSQVSGPSNGSVTVNSDGSFTYTPNQGYVGQDSFTFKANDGITDSTTATETIDVTNQAPVAGDGSVSTLHDHPVSGSLYTSDMDGDQVTVSLVGQASNGTVTVNSDGSFTYTPNQGYVGQDSFTFKSNDGITDSSTATETIDVTDNAPTAGEVDASVFTSEYDPRTVDVNLLSSSYDMDGDRVILVSYGSPQHGTLTNDGNGVVTYTPDNNPFVGVDTFDFTVSDGIKVAMAQAKVNVANVKVKLSLLDDGKIVPAPENSAYQNDVNVSGIDKLGPLDIGTGRALDLKDSAYTNALMIVGDVQPGGTVTTDNNITFSWNRQKIANGWNIEKGQDAAGNPVWQVTSQYSIGLSGDHSSSDYDDSTPSDPNGKIYTYDDPAANLAIYNGILTGGYMMEERTYIYTVTATQGDQTRTVGKLTIKQTIQAQRVQKGGSFADKWKGIQNSVAVGINSGVITQDDVRNLVGQDGVPIDLTNANPN